MDLREGLQEALTGRYTLERELGRGGMATVYLAHDLKHDRVVALKVMHPELTASVGPERFQREIRTTARLQHPHILPVLDSGAAAGQLWYTMPYVEGESLRDRLRRETQLPLDDALHITRELADALGYAHSQGVVHRDIKPENIMLTGGHALVADFGVARGLQIAARSDQLTETGMAVGTPTYMSPEQSLADPGLDARSDIYSLGCVLYEMLAGEVPYTGTSAQAIVAKRLHEPVPHVRSVRETVPLNVDQALERALAKMPADRFTTAAQFARALDILPNTLTTEPQRQGSPTPVSGAGWRPRTSVRLVGLAFGLSIGAGVLFAWWRGHTAEGAASTTTRRLAVLPFENLGDSADAYFADGVTDAVRDKLTSVTGLEVVASTSSNQYRHSDKPPQQIGRELGARYLLVGRVRWAKTGAEGSRVQVRPELIDTHDGTERWGEPFDGPLTDVFRVQSDVAAHVAEALGVALGGETRRQLAAQPTRNLDAYDAYLRAKELSAGERTPHELRAAEVELRRAVGLDSTFPAAWAELALTHIVLFRAGGMQAVDANAAHMEIQRASTLAPELPDVYAAKGAYEEVVRGNASNALRAYQAGLRVAPMRADLLSLAARTESDLGQWPLMLVHLEQAVRLDPRSPEVAVHLANAYAALGHFVEAQAALDRARALRPASMSMLYEQARLDIARGDSAHAREALHLAHQVADSASVVAYVALREDFLWLLGDAQQRLLLTLTPEALDGARGDWALALAETHWTRGDRQMARAYGDSARMAYDPPLREMLNEADRAQMMALQALALAYSGQEGEAVERGVEASKAAQLAAAPPWQLLYVQFLLARVYVLAGQAEGALEQLEKVLKTPSMITRGWLRIDPNFAPLRGNPRFERLVNGS